jgi:ankyrin repeat protein
MECLFDPNNSHFAAWLWIYNHDQGGHSMSTMSPEKPEAVPLYYAARFGFRDLTAHLLVEYPEDVLAKGGSNVTALHASVAHGHVNVLSLLLDHSPNPDIRGRWDQTPLHRLSESEAHKRHREVGQLLLDRGADVNACDDTNWTPLYMAALHGRLEIVRMLLDHGAAINSLSVGGQTPLNIASKYGYVEIVRLLLERGADPNVRSVNGTTPTDIAASEGHREVVQLLSEYSNNTKCIEE